jgi:hypothetical protein
LRPRQLPRSEQRQHELRRPAHPQRPGAPPPPPPPPLLRRHQERTARRSIASRCCARAAGGSDNGAHGSIIFAAIKVRGHSSFWPPQMADLSAK